MTRTSNLEQSPMNDLRYPIGEFSLPGALTEAQRGAAIADMDRAPSALRAAIAGLAAVQLDTPYRPGGWTVRQVVHHLPDSHMNCWLRLKLALTEDKPTIRTYEEKRWAELPDAEGPVEPSLELLDALHQRFGYLWRRIPAAAWERECVHPEIGTVRVDALLALYAWHGKHHVAHITGLRQREGW